jgi:hypothetical protein
MEPLFADALSKSIFSYVLMAVIATLVAVLIRGIVMLLAQAQTRAAKEGPTPVVVSVTPGRDENREIAAAIAAAVYAVLGAHRLVYIGEARPGFTWTSEIRSRLHTSHTPRMQRR